MQTSNMRRTTDQYRWYTYLVYRLYFVMMPFGSVGGSHDTSSDCGELTTTLMSAGDPGAETKFSLANLQPHRMLHEIMVNTRCQQRAAGAR
jgi:hypothetical protein